MENESESIELEQDYKNLIVSSGSKVPKLTEPIEGTLTIIMRIPKNKHLFDALMTITGEFALKRKNRYSDKFDKFFNNKPSELICHTKYLSAFLPNQLLTMERNELEYNSIVTYRMADITTSTRAYFHHFGWVYADLNSAIRNQIELYKYYGERAQKLLPFCFLYRPKTGSFDLVNFYEQLQDTLSDFRQSCYDYLENNPKGIWASDANKAYIHVSKVKSWLSAFKANNFDECTLEELYEGFEQYPFLFNFSRTQVAEVGEEQECMQYALFTDKIDWSSYLICFKIYITYKGSSVLLLLPYAAADFR